MDDNLLLNISILEYINISVSYSENLKYIFFGKSIIGMLGQNGISILENANIDWKVWNIFFWGDMN